MSNLQWHELGLKEKMFFVTKYEALTVQEAQFLHTVTVEKELQKLEKFITETEAKIEEI